MLVQVKAVSVNPIDTYIRAGTVAMELPKPFILGCDLAGVVESVGPEVKRLKAGDRVWGSNQGLLGRQGTFAQFAAVDEQWLYPIPEEVSFEDAAAIALVGITAHLGLFRDAQLKMGEKVFVHGGSGGVGSCVVQMARAIGARVMTTAGNDDKVQICRKLGANVVVNYRTGNVEEALQPFRRSRRVVGEPPRTESRAGHQSPGPPRADHRHGRPRGQARVADRAVLHPRCPVVGFAMFNSPADEQRKAAAEINRWLARGKLRPQIDRVMKLSEAAEAHKLQESQHAGEEEFPGRQDRARAV